MTGMPDAVNCRVAHNDIWGSHINFGPQNLFAVRKFSSTHAPEKIQVFFNTAIAPGAFPAWRSQRAAVFANLVCRKIVHVCLALANQIFCIFIKALKIIRSKKFSVFPVAAQPGDILGNGMDIFIFFLDRICIVKTQIALAAKFLCHAKIEANGLGMPKMQVTVGLWRKTGMHLAAETAGFVIFLNARPDEIRTLGLVAIVGHCPFPGKINL